METNIYNSEEELLIETQKGEIERVVQLINEKVNINHQDEGGNTALHYAVRYGYLEIVKYLLRNGADINIENALVETPLDIADKTSRFNIEEIEMALYKNAIDKSFNIIENFVTEETSDGGSNLAEKDAERDPKILEGEILKEIKRKENKMKTCLNSLKILNEKENKSDSKLTYEQANHFIFFLEAFAFKDFYVEEESEKSDQELKLGVQDYFARHIPDFKGGRRMIDDIRTLVCSCSKTKISVEDITTLLSPNIKIVNFFRILERYVKYICNNIDGRPNRNIVYVDITATLHVDENIGIKFSSDDICEDWEVFIGTIQEEGQWTHEKSQEMLFNFLVNISPAIEKKAESFDKLRNKIFEEFPHIDIKKKLGEVFPLKIESYLLYAGILNKIDSFKNKIQSCLDYLKVINKDIDPVCSKFIYKQANAFIFFLDAFQFRQNEGVENYFKKLIPSFCDDLELIKTAWHCLYKLSNKFVAVEDMTKLVTSGLDIVSFFKKLEDYVTYACNEINGLGTTADKPTHIDSILTIDNDFGTNCNDVLKENLLNLLNIVDKKEEWTEERTHEILFNFLVNIPPEADEEVCGLDSLRRSVISDFYTHKDVDGILKREFTKAVFELRSILFKYYYAKEVIDIFHRIEPGEDYRKIDADLRHSLLKTEEEFENTFKGESTLNKTSQNKDVEYPFFQSSLNPIQEELALNVLTKHYFKYMTILDDDITARYYENSTSCRRFNIRRILINEFINLRHIHSSTSNEYFEQKKDLRDSLVAYNGVKKTFYIDLCRLHIESGNWQEKNDSSKEKKGNNLEGNCRSQAENTIIQEEISGNQQKNNSYKYENKGNKEENNGNIEENNGNKEKNNDNKEENNDNKEENNDNKEENNDNKEENNDNKEENNGNKEENNDNKEENNDNKEENNDNKEENNGKKEKINGNKEKIHGNKDKNNGNKEENNGNNENNGNKEENNVNKEDNNSNKDENKGSKEENKSSIEENNGNKEENKGNIEVNKGNIEENNSNQMQNDLIEQRLINTLISLRRLQSYYQISIQDIISLYKRVVEGNSKFDMAKNLDLFRNWIAPKVEKPRFKKLKNHIKNWHKMKFIEFYLNDKIITINVINFISNILQTFYDAMNTYNIKFVNVEEAFSNHIVLTNLVKLETKFWKVKVLKGYYLFMIFKKLLKLKYAEPFIARVIIEEETDNVMEKEDLIKLVEDLIDEDQHIYDLNDLLNVGCKGVDLYEIVWKKMFDKNLESMRPIFEDPHHLEIILKHLQKSMTKESNDRVLTLEYNLIKYLNSIVSKIFAAGLNNKALEIVKVYTKHPIGEKSLAKFELLRGKRWELRIINWLGVLSKRKIESYVIAFEKQKDALEKCCELKTALEGIQENSVEFNALYLLNLSILAYTMQSLEDYIGAYELYENIYQRIKNFALHNTPVTILESTEEDRSSDFVDIVKSKNYTDLLNSSSDAAEYLDILKIRVSMVWLCIWNGSKNHTSFMSIEKEIDFYHENIERFKEIYIMKRLQQPEDRNVANITWKIAFMNGSASRMKEKSRRNEKEVFRHLIESIQFYNGTYNLQKRYSDLTEITLRNIFRILHEMARNRNSYIGWDGTNAIKNRLDKIRDVFIETLNVTKYIQKYGNQN